MILALDFPADPLDQERLIEPIDAYNLIEQLNDLVDVVKVGWPLYMAGRREDLIAELRKRGKRVFLDLKFGDISETVKRLVAVALREKVSFITVNTSIQAVKAAVEARGDSDLKVLTVTMLTSLDKGDLEDLGLESTVDQFVLHKTRQALGAKCDGVVASGREAAAIRREVAGKDFLIVTPGVRPAGAGLDDHKRAVTPTAAIQAGADYLVVGRPITKASSPVDATKRILEEMQRAFDAR